MMMILLRSRFLMVGVGIGCRVAVVAGVGVEC